MRALIRKRGWGLWSAVLGCGILGASAGILWAHCDTREGPVIQTAQAALESGDLQPVLKWIKEGDEDELRLAFKRATVVRRAGPEAKQLADQFFLETLVRLHRSGEGASFTGIKPPGTPVDPLIEAADSALARGTGVDDLARRISEEISSGIRARYESALDKRKHADDSVEAGRAYVEAYVEYVHFVEGVHALAAATGHEAHTAGHEHEAGHEK